MTVATAIRDGYDRCFKMCRGLAGSGPLSLPVPRCDYATGRWLASVLILSFLRLLRNFTIVSLVPIVVAPPTKASTNNELHDHVIARLSRIDANSEVQFPPRRDIEVDRRKQLVMLLSHGTEVGDRSQ